MLNENQNDIKVDKDKSIEEILPEDMVERPMSDEEFYAKWVKREDYPRYFWGWTYEHTKRQINELSKRFDIKLEVRQDLHNKKRKVYKLTNLLKFKELIANENRPRVFEPEEMSNQNQSNQGGSPDETSNKHQRVQANIKEVQAPESKELSNKMDSITKAVEAFSSISQLNTTASTLITKFEGGMDLLKEKFGEGVERYKEQTESIKRQASATEEAVAHTKQFNKMFLWVGIVAVIILLASFYLAYQKNDEVIVATSNAQTQITETVQSVQVETAKALQLLRDENTALRNDVTYYKQDITALKTQLDDTQTQLEGLKDKR